MSETVTPQREPGSKGGMNIFGWLMFLGMGVLLLPLVPLYLLLKLLNLVIDSDSPDRE